MLLNVLSAFNAKARKLRDRGAVAGEYAVLLAIISLALVTVLVLFTAAIENLFQTVIGFLP